MNLESSNPEMLLSPIQPLLIQVVPRLTPGRCGVSDHALVLARDLKDSFRVGTAFAVLNEDVTSDLPYAKVECTATMLLESCLELTGGRGGSILVHMSGYGYSPDGAPVSLAKALEEIKASGQFRIATYFHEIAASSWLPWKSKFWYSRRQQRALARIAASSGLIITNATQHAEWLGGESRRMGGVQPEMIPVFSTVGETESPVPAARRSEAMMVFGLAGTRSVAYQRIAESSHFIKKLGIKEIYDVGPEGKHPAEVNGIPVRRLGLLAAEELPAVFSKTRFGLATAEWRYLPRSSVFAGYCAQGVVPVLAGHFGRPVDGLTEGVHVVTPRTVDAAREAGWQGCADAVWNWYQSHRVRVHAERYAKWMGLHQ